MPLCTMHHLHLIQFLMLICFPFCRPTDAIPDFESVLKLNKDMACAHINIGLILMNHYQNYHRSLFFVYIFKIVEKYVK